MNESSNLTVDEGVGDPGLSMTIIFQTILFAAVCLVGLVGNTLVIYVVIRFSKMQTVTNMYIVNLAIADECFLIGIPFLLVTMINKQWIFGNAACKAYMISTSINQFTSSIFLCIMSADRYIAVCHPISSPKWRTPLISRIVSLLAWTCSIMLMTPIFEHATETESPSGRKSCIIDWHNNDNFSENSTAATGATVFTTYTFVFSFAIPLLLILVFYCLVIEKLKTVGPKNKSKEKKRSHRKVTNLVLTVVTVYVFCWLPYWITQIAMLCNTSLSTTHSPFVVTLHLMASCLSYSNSAMNPILYAFLSDNFKKSFLKACTCAAGKDVNATLHLENSVFPRKNKHGSERMRPTRGTSICPNNEDECDMGPLVSRGDQSTSAITMTSRTNITSLGDSRETISKSNAVKNGNIVTIHPTCL
ncbi:somatostatin receptor type 2 isoform X2 [Tribolium castaneum]|uniref:Allatostatin C-like G protein-coupled receptor n=2 Tax=Tribolium castaneum TaxID=7070 RepID=D6X173_TRICA|nr:somatostatin receptor type 2 [Tribolium castaneum]XP_008198487.1 PREDICTED: somatostatin receptor type 2 isoform X2 [Tribolium castaneum]XP_008198488.1 PREDICTED: somatostatin receptor type 2 isoform X2 [Tribolium castaneum]XP_015838939.1 PREDICTED: somatostatin receptor type 2 isoform X2 [Tribolium castaneum]XP_015838940.1 PREDICTED: somatostatin receptor type 2 isoform X2 [Tribolium castaneum]XP_015838941.1 PREDICTED: somatostatin receptor type 2 isoform X2 [Tribolium castaneum]EFA10792.|eukprot:NP_001280521.1 somatostatin receptor type 2 [Tribolium castaneum]